MAGVKGKVVLFGKTGDGKSTVSNALVTGGIEDLKFTIGHGVKGCTSQMKTDEGRGWTVTDTVGLGEGEGGKVSTEAAEEMILEFLKNVKGEYSHVIYVKSSANRFDVLDETIWKSFKRIFKGAEGAFTVLFTKGTEEWLEKNWTFLPNWVKDLDKANVLITDIPPISDKKVRESRNQAVRTASIVKLEKDLLNAFQLRGGKYSTPNISRMNESALVAESKSILTYIQEMLNSMVEPLIATLNIFSTVGAIMAMFA